MIYGKAIFYVSLLALAKSLSSQNEIGSLWPRTSDNRIFFDMPDLTLTYVHQNSQYQLEAYKAADNDKILSENNELRYGELLWVSLGHPLLVKTTFRSNERPQLFHFSHERFYTYVNMLTDDIREILALKAREKYKIPVSSQQIVLMPMSEFSCKLKMNTNEGRKIIFNGAATNLKTSPVQLDFWIPSHSTERIALANRIEKDGELLDLAIECVMASQGRMARVNTLTITASQIAQMDLVDQVFGDADSNYVSREQFFSLSAHVYNSLNIVEEYEMSEYEFSQVFIDDFIKQTSATTLAHVSLDEALASISTYAISFKDDLKPDVIRRDAGRIFKLTEFHNKSNIMIDDEGLNYLHEIGKVTGSGNANVNVLGLFNAGASVSYAEENEHEWLNSHKSRFEQLGEINSVSIDDVQWEFEGEKIVPKSLNVARLLRASFTKTLSFSRVRRMISEANFTHSTSLYTKASVLVPTDLQLIEKKLAHLDQKLEQQASSSEAGLKKLERDILYRDEVFRDAVQRVTNKFDDIQGIINVLKADLENHKNDAKSHIKWAFETGQFGKDESNWVYDNHGLWHHGNWELLRTTYNTPFIETPYLILSPCKFDATTKDGAIRMYVQNLVNHTNKYFEIRVRNDGFPTWHATQFHSFRICWLAIGQV